MERIVSRIISELEAQGLHAIRGYDGSLLPILDAPMVAVSIADVRYFPLCAGSYISEDESSCTSGLRVEAQFLLDVYDDYRHGDRACVEAATLAASVCSALSGDFTCGNIQLGCVHYVEDYDCFRCSLSVPVHVFIARSLTL